jgi:hypothetical protein
MIRFCKKKAKKCKHYNSILNDPPLTNTFFLVQYRPFMNTGCARRLLGAENEARVGMAVRIFSTVNGPPDLPLNI